LKKGVKKALYYILLLWILTIMCYPIIWLFFSSFKTNTEIFGSNKLLPSSFSLRPYIEGWKGVGNISYGTFFKNTFLMVIPTVFFTVLSSSVVAYGFARFRFPLKRVFFALMLSTLMLPDTVIIIPKYMLFRDFKWLNTYLPFIVPTVFAATPFFIFMLVQFFRGLPRELDESAVIDGCGSLRIFFSILMPLCKPALISAAIFQFIWTWNDFFSSLIYITEVRKFTLSLALRMSSDVQSATSWDKTLAMSVLTIIPPVMIFFFAQKYFVEGISTTGIKG